MDEANTMHSGCMQGLSLVCLLGGKRCLGKEEFVQMIHWLTLKDPIQEGRIHQMAQIFLGIQQQERKQILPNNPG